MGEMALVVVVIEPKFETERWVVVNADEVSGSGDSELYPKGGK